MQTTHYLTKILRYFEKQETKQFKQLISKYCMQPNWSGKTPSASCEHLSLNWWNEMLWLSCGVSPGEGAQVVLSQTGWYTQWMVANPKTGKSFKLLQKLSFVQQSLNHSCEHGFFQNFWDVGTVKFVQHLHKKLCAVCRVSAHAATWNRTNVPRPLVHFLFKLQYYVSLVWKQTVGKDCLWYLLHLAQ